MLRICIMVHRERERMPGNPQEWLSKTRRIWVIFSVTKIWARFMPLADYCTINEKVILGLSHKMDPIEFRETNWEFLVKANRLTSISLSCKNLAFILKILVLFPFTVIVSINIHDIKGKWNMLWWQNISSNHEIVQSNGLYLLFWTLFWTQDILKWD